MMYALSNCWCRPLSDAFVMLSYRAVSHFDSQASVVTRTLSETDCSKNKWLKIELSGVKNWKYLCIYFSTEMSQARFMESCVLTWFFKHFKGGNFVASRKTHWLTSVASANDFTGSKRKNALSRKHCLKFMYTSSKLNWGINNNPF